VRLTVQVVDSRRVLAAVASREVDVGVLALPAAHPEVELVPVFEERLVCVAGGARSPGAPRSMPLSTLAAEPLVLYARGSITRAEIDAVFESHGLSPNVVMETASPEAMKRLAEVGVGLSILPELLVREEIASGRLRLVRLQDAVFVRRLATAVHRGRQLAETARRFLELVHRRYPRLPGLQGESSAGPTRLGGPRTRRRGAVRDTVRRPDQ
jgi:DNA-binding transcriptional LysR family regulator